jgi:hypothetical protein
MAIASSPKEKEGLRDDNPSLTGAIERRQDMLLRIVVQRLGVGNCQPEGTGDGFETHGCCDEQRSQRATC